MNDVKTTHPLRLVITGIQPFVYCWVVIAILGILTYVLNADAPSLGELTWRDAGSVTTGWWLTALGARLHVSGVVVSLPPLLITAIVFYIAWLLIRRVPIAGVKDVAIMAVSGGLTVGLIGLLAPVGSITWPASGGAILIIIGACLLSKNRDDWFSSAPFQTLSGRITYDSLMMTRKIVVVSILFASLVFVVSFILAWSDVTRISDFYILDVLSTIMLWLFQLAYLPNVIVWTLFFLMGSGFHVGHGTSFSTLDVSAAPLPAVPMFGALPQPGGSYWWLLIVLVIVMMGFGAYISRSFPTMKEALVTAGVQVLTTGFVCALMGALATGSIGPERMSSVGAVPPGVALGALLTLGLPFFIGVVAFHATARDRYRIWFGAAQDKAKHAREDLKAQAAQRKKERAESILNVADSAPTPPQSDPSPTDISETGQTALTAADIAPTAATAPTSSSTTALSASTPEDNA